MSLIDDNIKLDFPIITDAVQFDFDTLPSVSSIVSFSTLESYLTAYGIWQKFDVFHCRIGWSASEITANEHLKNQVDGVTLNTATNMTHSNSFGFIPNSVSTSSLTWNYNPSAGDNTNYLVSNACYGVYINNQTALTPGDELQSIGNNGPNEINRYDFGPGPESVYRINNKTANTYLTAVAEGMVAISYNGTSGIVYNNSVANSSTFVGVESLAGSFIEFQQFSDTKHYHAFSFAGGYLTSDELSTLEAALDQYYNFVNS